MDQSSPQRFLIHTPVHWPMMWISATDIRTACPGCGNFSLFIRRPETSAPTIACESCNLGGVAPVQRAFDKLMGVKTPPTKIKEAIA
jgi:hypothetical protein